MAHTDLISIITPAYNAERYIVQAIESVLAQTYPHWEMIIVDDGSTDNTAQAVKQFAAKDTRIKYIYQANGKQGKARNNALNHASGKYIAFLDADDIWIKNKLELQIEFFKIRSVDLIFSNAYVFNETLSERENLQIKPALYKGTEGLQQFLLSNKIPILTVLTTKDIIENCGGFSEITNIQNAEDYHLWLKMLITGKTFECMNETLAYYRLHTSAATANDKDAILQVLYVFGDLVKAYPQQKNLFSQIILKRIDGYLIHSIISNYNLFNQLLITRNAYGSRKTSLFFWRLVYRTFDYRICRKLFLLLNKTFH